MIEYFRKLPLRRTIMMCLAIVVMGLGIALFKLSGFGNDATSGMVMAIADNLGNSFSITLIVVNSVWFLCELKWARNYIGIGTVINWIFVGIFTDAFYSWLLPLFRMTLSVRLGFLSAGVLILSFSCALYQTSDVGIAPYDSLAIILTEKTHIKYFFCRIFTDAVCLVVTYFLGGIIGAGTFICALGLGPFVSFFTKHGAVQLCGVKSKFV